MILALAVLAYLVFITMNESEKFKNNKKQVNKHENFAQPHIVENISEQQMVEKKMAEKNMMEQKMMEQKMMEQKMMEQQMAEQQMMEQQMMEQQMMEQQMMEQQMMEQQRNAQMSNNINYELTENTSNNNEKFSQKENIKAQQPNISYENFAADISGIADDLYGAAPFGDNAPVNQGDMATVKYTGLVDAKPGDVIQIEGTDLLTAPLIDNMLYTNSIANTNRNASQDLRGDIPLQFNDTYTPFYSSVIYGAPLSQHNMTINKM
jgi:hypothetical protein